MSQIGLSEYLYTIYGDTNWLIFSVNQQRTCSMFPKLTILSQLGKKEKHFHFSYHCRFTIFIDKPNFIFQGQDYRPQFCIRIMTAKVNNIKPFDCDMTLALCLLTTSFFIERREVDRGPSKLSWASSRPENWKFKFILKIWFPNSFKIRLYYFNFHKNFSSINCE